MLYGLETVMRKRLKKILDVKIVFGGDEDG